jgi:hypothetical protein
VIRSRNPKIDVEALEAKIVEELAAEPAMHADGRLARLAAAVHVRTIENSLERAEERSMARSTWPAEIRAFPFGNVRLQRFVLRLMALAFRDQQEVNSQLIGAQRETLTLMHTLIDRIADLETRSEADRAAARAERIARRNESA